MKKNNLIVGIITLILFVIPFFWLPRGFVDLGGDAGRLYFIDPIAVIKNTGSFWNSIYPFSYASVPYLFFLNVILRIVGTSTNLISFEHGLQLSLSFFGMYLIVRQLLFSAQNGLNVQLSHVVGILSGVVYVGLITKVGWPVALPTLNQVFLNVFMFYLLLRYCVTQKFFYLSSALFLSIAFSINFGLGNAPQLFSFYPLALLFLYIYIRFVAQIMLPWRGLFLFVVLLLGLHSFHLLPLLASLLEKRSGVHDQAFSANSIQVSGVNYFAANHADSGKISKELFQWWMGSRFLSWHIPFIAVSGFLIHKSRLLLIIGLFFAFTLFLVAANITQTGVAVYQKLFYIPGFVMFRSFNEKWFFVYAFFYTLLFSVSLYYLLRRVKIRTVFTIGTIIFGIFVYRAYPFLSGGAIDTILHQSNNVSAVFAIDPNLMDALAFVRTLPPDGKMLTLPLTFPYFQLAFGKEGGAYEGISMVSNLIGRQDYAGFWTFGPYEKPMFHALNTSNKDQFLQLLSLLNVRYIFRNSDARIMDNFPLYPYLEGGTYASKEQLPPIKDQLAYDAWLGSLPVKKIYQVGFYQVYEIEDSFVRPLIYIPDYVSLDLDKGPVNVYRWAFGNATLCEDVLCDQKISVVPSVSYTKESETSFNVQIDLKGVKEPFLLVFSNNYYYAVDLTLQHMTDGAVRHVMVNGFANGWVIDPANTDEKSVLQGRIYLTSMNYLYAGIATSGITLTVIIVFVVGSFIRRRNEKN